MALKNYTIGPLINYINSSYSSKNLHQSSLWLEILKIGAAWFEPGYHICKTNALPMDQMSNVVKILLWNHLSYSLLENM